MCATGYIGYEPTAVERNIDAHFSLAQEWGCVVLLDEADVFLGKRNVSEWVLICTHSSTPLKMQEGRRETERTGLWCVTLPLPTPVLAVI